MEFCRKKNTKYTNCIQSFGLSRNRMNCVLNCPFSPFFSNYIDIHDEIDHMKTIGEKMVYSFGLYTLHQTVHFLDFIVAGEIKSIDAILVAKSENSLATA